MKTIITACVFVFLIFLAAIVGLDIAASAQPELASLRATHTMVTNAAIGTWNFVRPVLQLVIVLLVLEWFAQRLGIKVDFRNLGVTWNVQMLIAVLVVVSFCIAALGNIPGSSDLKDLALAVVGFYFGSRQAAQTRQLEAEKEEQKVG